MKSTGITRPIDELGRFVLPIEIRRQLGINVKDHLEIYTDENRIILQKHAPACIFCGEADNVVLYADKRVCRGCIEKMKNL